MASSGWTSAFPMGPRVRPMSAAELRRGERSALHCSGTRTLQVRNPSHTPPPPPLQPNPFKNLPSDPSVPSPTQLDPRRQALLPPPEPRPPWPRPWPRPHSAPPPPQVSPPGGGPEVAFRFGAVLDGARTQEDVFRACGVRRLGELALRG